MLMIRLQRVGRKNDPSFRVVIVDSHMAAKTGRVIEVVGSHNAKQGEPQLSAERINYWLSVGAKTSDTANNLLVKKGIIKGAKINVASKKLGKKAQAVLDKKKAEAEKAKADAQKAEEEKAANLAKEEETKLEESPIVAEEMPEVKTETTEESVSVSEESTVPTEENLAEKEVSAE